MSVKSRTSDSINWPDAMKKTKTEKKEKAKGASLGQRLMGSPSQIWKSRLSWRIALSVFLTIMTVQAGIMSVTVGKYKQARLSELLDSARSGIVPLIETSMMDFLESPIDQKEAQRLTTTTNVMGLSVYSRSDLSLLGSYGSPVLLSLITLDNIPQNYLSADNSFYEVVLKPNDLTRPYYIIARLDSGKIKTYVRSYIEESILIMMLMSAFVTTVLMIALGHWLLEPILFLRQNLVKASENPESPNIQESPFTTKDEIGGAIKIAQELIHQNANNLNQIKSAAEDKIHKLAYYDTLTGLPNRTLFLKKLEEQSKEIDDNKGGQFAVIALDLDHFKDVNDSMGHNVGDAILRAVGKRLRASLPESATVARSGEDEFAVTIPLSSGNFTSRDIADRVSSVMKAEPFKVFNENFQIRASIGVSTYPDDGTDPDQVLKNADIALNRAKEEGRDRIREYSEDFDRAVQQRFQMLRDLRDGMEDGQLTLHYQAQLDLKSGAVIGAEALLRWWKPNNNKDGGTFISPAEFIPIAEQSGLIVPIGEMVLRTACETAMGWAEQGHNIRIAVNVSGAQFYQSDLVSFVSKTLNETKLPPHMLELEVTESVFMEDITHAINTLKDLHGLGVELAIDDFGTGYSSLSYLRQFPIDRLKIDQSFIRNALNNNDDAAIAKTIVRLGHSLNLKVIAEGVETKEHEQFLIDEGCDEVQGFRYARPMPITKFSEFIKSYNGDISTFDVDDA